MTKVRKLELSDSSLQMQKKLMSFFWGVILELPATVETPPGPLLCNCPGHLEKLELEQNFKVSAKTLNRLLFSDDSPVWKEFHNRRNNTSE